MPMRRSSLTAAIAPASIASSARITDGTGVRTRNGGSVITHASDAQDQAGDADVLRRGGPRWSGGDRTHAHAVASSGLALRLKSTRIPRPDFRTLRAIRSVETSSTIRPWIISVRFDARFGSNTLGSRKRSDVPV